MYLLNISLLSPDTLQLHLSRPGMSISQKLYPEAIVNVVLHHII